MPVEKFFIDKGMKRVELETFLAHELGRAGYGGVDIRRTLTGTRVTISVERPGMVIGRKGKSIKQLTEELEKKFGLENPQVEVVEIQKPELSGPIMAKHLAFALERGLSVRSVGHNMVRRIMNAGARGVEIVISGRIGGERSRVARFYQGYLSKAGEPAKNFVSSGQAVAMLKPGTAGIKVSIMPPDVSLPGEIRTAWKETRPAEPVPKGETPKEKLDKAEDKTTEEGEKVGDTEE
jgi:small subunit ribosomal protein S3